MISRLMDSNYDCFCLFTALDGAMEPIQQGDAALFFLRLHYNVIGEGDLFFTVYLHPALAH